VDFLLQEKERERERERERGDNGGKGGRSSPARHSPRVLFILLREEEILEPDLRHYLPPAPMLCCYTCYLSHEGGRLATPRQVGDSVDSAE